MIVRRYKDEEEKNKIIANTAQKYKKECGFFVTDRIRTNVMYGLTDAKRVSAKQFAPLMKDDDRVVGISHKGQSVAYPYFITDYYHYMNDVIGGDPVVFQT